MEINETLEINTALSRLDDQIKTLRKASQNGSKFNGAVKRLKWIAQTYLRAVKGK